MRGFLQSLISLTYGPVSRRIEGMVKMSTPEKNRLHAATSFDEMSEIVRNDIEVNLRRG